MRQGIDRRRGFLKGAAAALASAALAPSAFAFDTADTATPVATPASREKNVACRKAFAPADVRLLESDFSQAAAINLGYLRTLPVDRLARAFRVQAGIPTTAAAFGGWEKPDCELRGHFTGGHYLSAAALAWACMDDAVLKQRGDELVVALAACQRPNGYLSAFPESFFDRLSHGQKVWAPFYTVNKILAGMLDMHTLAGNAQALTVATGIGTWTVRWLNGFSDEDIAKILKTEYGGMNEALYDLYALTGDERYRETAHRFDQAALFDPLLAHRDALQGLHSNTQVPKILGAARRYELTGEPRYRRIAEFFYETVTENRAYANGGSSNDEFWKTAPGDLKDQLGLYSAECCVAYNLMKLARHVYAWQGDPRVFDYYERALYNARLGTQDEAGMKLYYYPLQPGAAKLYNSPFDSFWCCTGSGAEEFARFSDSIYHHDDSDLYVNLFIPSTLRWREKGLGLRQETAFPREPRTRYRVSMDAPRTLAIHLRVPSWIGAGAAVRVNGDTLPATASPGSYLTLQREWHDGDTIEMDLPMALHSEALAGDDTRRAVFYGPLVLAARLGAKGLTHDMQYGRYDAGPSPEPKPAPTPRIDAPTLGDHRWIAIDSAPQLRFHATTRDGRVDVIPLNQIAHERYAVYWQTEQDAIAGNG